jgi:hypothetical protein
MKKLNPAKGIEIRSSLACLLALMWSLGMPLSSRAATLVVTTLADGGSGSLREAIAFANTNWGDVVITFDPALSGQTISLTSGAELVLSAGRVTIDASALPNGITVSADVRRLTLHRVFRLVPGAEAVEFDNLTIQGGHVAQQNYPVLNQNPGNNDSSGGGILMESGVRSTLTLNNCILTGNYAQDSGGAIAVITPLVPPSTLILNNCTISNNIARFGGGIFCHYSHRAVINNSTVSANAAIMRGGGIYGHCTLNSSTLYNNFALRTGGGIVVRTSVTANNSTIAGNAAPYGGGFAIEDGGSLLGLNNSTVSANAASASGGGIEFASGMAGFSRLTNSIVAGNSAPANSNLNAFVPSSNSLTNGNPLLAALGNYGGPTLTMPPLAGSPALDAGNDLVTNFLGTDQRGYPRLSGAHVDIGAVEIQVVTAANAPVLTNPVVQPDGAFAFSFTSSPDAAFNVLGSTNLSQWNFLGPPAHNPPGQYQFTDPGATNHPKRFYKVASP